MLLPTADDALKQLFPGTKTTMFKLQKLLSKHCKTSGGRGAGCRARGQAAGGWRLRQRPARRPHPEPSFQPLSTTTCVEISYLHMLNFNDCMLPACAGPSADVVGGSEDEEEEDGEDAPAPAAKRPRQASSSGGGGRRKSKGGGEGGKQRKPGGFTKECK